MAMYGFEVGRLYHRRSDIHDRFGGQRQGGIATPADTPVVFAFTGEEGAAHGYEDYWSADGVFCYFGEGQRGDMVFQRGNAAIRNHTSAGKDLLLFRMEGDRVRFLGEFVCESWDQRAAPDADGNQRRAIVFHLIPNDLAELATEDAVGVTGTSLAELRDAAFAAAATAPERREGDTREHYIARSRAVRDYILARAEGRCERCFHQAPFARTDGSPFLEVHHIRRLSDGGPDDPRHVAGICPNCHREAHYGQHAAALNRELAARVRAIEAGGQVDE